MAKRVMTLTDAIKSRYPHQSEKGQLLRQRVEAACRQFIDSNLGDDNAEQKLCSTDDRVFWQQFSEVLFSDQLTKAGLHVSHGAEGPDFLFMHERRKIWIEVICPEPTRVPDEWTKHISGSVVTFPHEAILLRWTAAIKEKAEKLLGNSAKSVRGYIDKGIVGANDVYLIAINSRLLRGFGGAFPELYGISQFPFAVEATFSIGPIEVHIDRNSMKVSGSGHQHRPLIPKPSGSSVPADTFLDPKFSPISALWAADIDELLLLNEARPMVIIHNPLGKNPAPRNLLPAQSEYVATDNGAYYQLDRYDGLLAI